MITQGLDDESSRDKPLNLRILTTLIKDKIPVWGDSTELLPGWREEVERTWRKRRRTPFYRNLLWGWRFFRASRRYNAVLTGFQPCGMVFAFLQRILRRRRIDHIYIDTHLGYTLPANPLKKYLRKFILGQFLRPARKAVVFSKRQCDIYAHEFKEVADRFVTIPYYPTLFGEQPPALLGNYIFAGGDYTRDYPTFLEAVRPLPYRVIIAALYRHYFDGIDIPQNVEILTTNHESFLRLMAEAAAVVIPLKGGLLRSGGEQTYLNAMALGKAVIVADDGGAEEYINTGVNGFVLKPGDADSLRKAIVTLMEDRELACSIGLKAKTAAARFSPERFTAQVLDLARECVNESRRR